MHEVKIWINCGFKSEYDCGFWLLVGIPDSGFKSEYDCGFWLLVGIPELQQIKDNNKGEVMAHQYCSFQKGLRRVVDDKTFQI